MRTILTGLFVFLATITFSQETIIVERGESFESIAVRHGITVEALLDANPGKEECYTGMKLIVPPPTGSPIGDPSISSKLVLTSDSLLYLASTKAESGRYKDAMKLYNRVIDMQVRRPYGYAGRGRCYYALGKYKKAKHDLQTAIYSREMAYEERALCEEALADVEESIREKRARRKSFWENLGLAFASAAATTASAYAAAEQNRMQQAQFNMPSPAYTASGSSGLSRANAIIAQSNANINQMMARGNAQLNMMTQQTMMQAQQTKQRMDQAFKDEIKWSGEFYNKNGRQPSEYEVDQWYAANYPDLLESRIMARGSQGKTSDTSDDEQDKEKPADDYKTRQKSTKACPYCKNGRVEYNKSVTTFGQQGYMKKCDECGTKYYSNTAHFHLSCSHCGGSGYMK